MPSSLTQVAEVFRAFLRLGLTSFGGPIAHIGYFRLEFVERRAWVSDSQFAQMLAISQFLPGPASSQLGFTIGLTRAGALGALAAFVAFTAPSAALLFALANLGAWSESAIGAGVLHGLKLAAVVVVSDGVLRMARTMAPDWPRTMIAAGVVALMVFQPSAISQVVAIGVGALLGGAFVKSTALDGHAAALPSVPRGVAIACGAAFALLLAFALWWPTSAPVVGSVFTAFWRAGSLVFGGGHVVLPLLEASVVDTGWINADVFLAGYGAAQAIPGPMFSLAAFLGAAVPTGQPPVLGAVAALIGVFAPGFLLLVSILPVWARITASARARSAVAGVNAAVVGLLGAALYDPVVTSGIHAWPDAAIAATGVGSLWSGRRSPLLAVLWAVAAAVVVATLS